VSDWTPETLTRAALDNLRAIQLEVCPLVPRPERLAAPLRRVGKFVAVGLNYKDHAAESNMPVPKEPILFLKASSCLSGPNDPIRIPRGATKVDWEVELGVVIGATACYVSRSDAPKYVAGYTVVHDVSERAFQFERGGQWDKGKGCDTFGPVGPWLVTPDEVPDVQNLDLWLDVNGVRKQHGTTANMIFPVAELISYISQFMTLEPGDVITTGTPSGVGMGRNPPEYFKAGDVVSIGVTGLGAQQQNVVVA
jgi:2-keto-4-pentenoate hydratase/2-oxohepta-3-ene-1,7-dioic acid hydratase in catechol pathway